MLTPLLGYVLLGLLLALPLKHLLLWLASRSGLFQPRWHYLQAYVPVAQRTAAQAGAPDARPATQPAATP